MKNITYTFGSDAPADLSGKTFSGGEFCRLDGAWKGMPDAVSFGIQIVAGKTVVLKAKIAGNPELEQALEDHKSAEAKKESVLSSIGWPQYQAARNRAINARCYYGAASAYGYPAKEAAAMHIADEALDIAKKHYPLAAAYALAMTYSFASHDQKASAGRSAVDAIKSGADPLQAIEKMESEWLAAAGKCCDNA